MKIPFSKIVTLGLLHLMTFSFGVASVSAYDASAGISWGSNPVPYYINSAFASSFRTAMKTSDATWDASGADFSFTYTSTTTRNPNVWSSSYTTDGYSDIGYYDNGYNLGIIATTTASGAGSTITEVDTTFNTYNSFTTTGAAGKYDVQDLMTHEFGHWLFLDDLSSAGSPSYCSSSAMSTMCGASYPGQTYRRSLRTDDKDGIKSIYGT